jgi:hypothetical protein
MNTHRTIMRGIAGAASVAAFLAVAACSNDAPTQDIGNVDEPTEQSEFAPKYGEHSDNFVEKEGTAGTLDNKPPADFQP